MEMSEMMGIKNLYFDGDMEAAPALAGQSVGLIDKVKSVEDIINETILEFNQTVSKLSESKFDE
jgi:enoyl-[acyl-carrier protein] reductase II